MPRHDAACMWHEPKTDQGTAKEVCELFKVRAKQLSQVIMRKIYLSGGQKKGPKECAKKGKKHKEPEEEEKEEEEKDALPTKKAHSSKTGTDISKKTKQGTSQTHYIIHYHLQLKCIHSIIVQEFLERHGILHSSPSHSSPIPVQAAHSGVH